MEYGKIYKAINSDECLVHWGKGKTKSSHKYISRYWKNGRWNYVYNSPSKQKVEINSKEQVKNTITKETRDAEDRYRKAYHEYQRANRSQNSNRAEIQQLRRRTERLKADYEKTKAAEKQAYEEFTKLSKRKTAKEYISDAKNWLGNIEGTLRTKSLKGWLGEIEANMKMKH